jgi:hypothetical protein
MHGRFLLITLLLGSLGVSLPSLAHAETPCSPAKPAANPITVTSNSIGTLQVSWKIGHPSPVREWVQYWSETESLQNRTREAGLENGTARSTELTNLHPGEPYKVFLALEYVRCIEDKVNAGRDLASAWSLAPTVHFYNALRTGFAEPGALFPAGKVGTANFGTWGSRSITYLPTVEGTTTNYVRCGALDSDWTFANGEHGGTATWTIINWTASECSQSGYCAAGEAAGLELKPLPLVSDTYEAYNGYRFSHMKFRFTVTCNGKSVENIVESKEINNGVLAGYWSNGRYEKSAPPNFDLDDGGHYGKTYGNGGDMELEGSGGRQVIQPRIYWYYLGYGGAFAEDVIPTEAP